MPDFLSALELAAGFYREIVAPLAQGVAHSAALLGAGSEVLGYDTPRSTDHDWGPRVQLFATGPAIPELRRRIEAALPATYSGWPTRIGSDRHPIGHRVEVLELGAFLVDQLGVDATGPIGTAEWLRVPQQQLLGIVRGRVYADPEGVLADVRRRLRYFPDDVWRYLLASQWRRLAQEEPFVGRTAEVGDELGSRVIAGRQVRDCMRMAFLLQRTYWPYVKWLGTVYAELPLSASLTPHLVAATAATDAVRREAALVSAYETLARQQNALGITPEVDATARRFFTRPYQVLDADRFADACRESITDPVLRELPLIGSVDQWVDSTDVLSGPIAADTRLIYAALMPVRR